MNFPETKPAPAPESPERKAILELKRLVASMRLMFQLLALCCLMLTGTIFVLFFKQLSVVRHQVEESVSYIQDYNKTFIPQIEIVRANLETFARTNESLTPLMRRYFSTNAAKAPGPGAVSTNR